MEAASADTLIKKEEDKVETKVDKKKQIRQKLLNMLKDDQTKALF